MRTPSALLLCSVVAVGLVASCVGDEPPTGSPNDGGPPLDAIGADTASSSDTGAGGDGASSNETGTTDGGADAADAALPPACDPVKPFGLPVIVPIINDAAANDSHAVLTDDELTIFFASDRQAVNHYHVFSASRATRDGAFSSPSPLQVIYGVDERHPTVNADGTVIFFDALAPQDAGVGPYYIVTATRGSQAVNFGPPAPIGGRYLFNGGLTGNAGAIYAEDLVSGQIARLPNNGAGYGPQQDLVNVGNDYGTTFPVSRDDLTLYVNAGSRPSTHGGDNIWVYARASTSAAYGTPTELSSVNSDGDERPTWLSADGCRLYVEYIAKGATQTDVYVATRPK